MKKALITGINGQVGSYLAEFLLSKDYIISGCVLPSEYNNNVAMQNLSNIAGNINLYSLDVTDHNNLKELIEGIQPDELYHLAALSFVSYNPEDEEKILFTNLTSTHYLLSILKRIKPDTKFYFAGTSEMFGQPDVSPQDENTRFNPKSIYGISKLAGYHLVKYYRDYHNVYACTGITYNHESVRRPLKFVTRKITNAAAQIKLGLIDKIELGNIDVIRDWGYIPDFVQAMWLMLNNQDGPKDYVIASGKGHTVKEFLEISFRTLDLDYRQYLSVNPDFYRPTECVPLIGNPKKIYADIGWQPVKSFEEIVKEMTLFDYILHKNTV